MTARRLGHVLAIPLLGAVLGLGGSAAHLLPAASPCAAATYSSHVTLVVEHGDGGIIGLCIGFDGSSITGEEILQASGLEYATAGYGALGDAVCQIDDEPAAYDTCLPSSGPYWMIFVARGGGWWQVADRGISTETFSSGDAEGFRYDPQDGPDPAPASPAGLCAAALAGTPATASSAAGGSSSGGSGEGSSRSTTGGSSGSASGTAQPFASVVPLTGVATAQADAPAPSAAVVTPADEAHSVTAGPTPLAVSETGITPALLVVAVVVGALTGLMAVQLLLRLRRT
jgi:hypothetical protein